MAHLSVSVSRLCASGRLASFPDYVGTHSRPSTPASLAPASSAIHTLFSAGCNRPLDHNALRGLVLINQRVEVGEGAKRLWGCRCFVSPWVQRSR